MWIVHTRKGIHVQRKEEEDKEEESKIKRSDDYKKHARTHIQRQCLRI